MEQNWWAQRLAERPQPMHGRGWRLLRTALLTALLLFVSAAAATDLFRSLQPGQWLTITWRTL